MMDIFIAKLQENLRAPLPGMDAQFKMAHVGRRNGYKIPEHAKQAGVLILFYPKADHWHLVFIERVTTNKRGSHSGQIAFPGGRYEESDDNLISTAIREAQEEVGILPDTVNFLGKLSPMYIPVSNFLVSPSVAFTDHAPTFIPQQSEVNAIIEVPFERFLKPETAQLTQLRLSNNIILNNVPYYDLFGKKLWGATAMIMSELIEVVS